MDDLIDGSESPRCVVFWWKSERGGMCWEDLSEVSGIFSWVHTVQYMGRIALNERIILSELFAGLVEENSAQD